MDNDIDTSYVTISVEQRNGKKMKTFVYGIDIKFDLKKILSHLKNTLNCSGTIKKDEKYGEIMIFTGNNKKAIYDFLVKEEISSIDNIVLKGL